MEFFHYLRVGDSQYIPPSSSSALYTHPDIFISAVWFLNEVKFACIKADDDSTFTQFTEALRDWRIGGHEIATINTLNSSVRSLFEGRYPQLLPGWTAFYRSALQNLKTKSIASPLVEMSAMDLGAKVGASDSKDPDEANLIDAGSESINSSMSFDNAGGDVNCLMPPRKGVRFSGVVDTLACPQSTTDITDIETNDGSNKQLCSKKAKRQSQLQKRSVRRESMKTMSIPSKTRPRRSAALVPVVHSSLRTTNFKTKDNGISTPNTNVKPENNNLEPSKNGTEKATSLPSGKRTYNKRIWAVDGKAARSSVRLAIQTLQSGDPSQLQLTPGPNEDGSGELSEQLHSSGSGGHRSTRKSRVSVGSVGSRDEVKMQARPREGKFVRSIKEKSQLDPGLELANCSSNQTAAVAMKKVKDGKQAINNQPSLVEHEVQPDAQITSDPEQVGHENSSTNVEHNSPSSRPFIHQICGRGFAQRHHVMFHHEKVIRGHSRGCWVKHGKPDVAWDAHPSCQIEKK